MIGKSNWYVITGGPSSGKSSTLFSFEKMGYKIVLDTARVLIDKEMANGKTIKEIRRDEAEFQRKVLAMKIETEDKLLKEEVIFFDRAIPDSAAYYSVCGLNSKEVLDICQKDRYKKVFFLEQLPVDYDYARVENKQTVDGLNQLLKQTYKQLGCEIVFVPVMSLEKRVKFIKEHM